MAHVDALGAPDPRPPHEGVMHVPEERVPGLRAAGSPRGARPSRSPGAAPARHRAVRGPPGGCACRARPPCRRHSSFSEYSSGRHLVRRPVGGDQPGADEAERDPVDHRPGAVEHLVTGLAEGVPQARDVHVAVGEVGGLGQGIEEGGVLLPDRLLGEGAQVGAAVGGQPGRDAGRERPGLVEPAGGAQVDVLLGVLGAVEIGEDPLAYGPRSRGTGACRRGRSACPRRRPPSRARRPCRARHLPRGPS